MGEELGSLTVVVLILGAVVVGVAVLVLLIVAVVVPVLVALGVLAAKDRAEQGRREAISDEPW